MREPALERIAHRGAKREYPENTLPAFARAFELGADAVELDVHATRDGVVVVHHDPDLRLGGVRRLPIAGLDWADLDGADVAVPRLADVLAAAPPGKAVYVEIKGKRIEQLVVSVVSAATVRCAIHSFDHDAVRRVREIGPQIPRGILFDKQTKAWSSAVAATGARDVWPEWRLVDRALVAQAHELGCRVIAWTVNDKAEAARLAALGVDGICTDDVRLLLG